MLREGIQLLKIVFGCPRRAFGYTGYKAWAARAEGIRIPRKAFRC